MFIQSFNAAMVPWPTGRVWDWQWVHAQESLLQREYHFGESTHRLWVSLAARVALERVLGPTAPYVPSISLWESTVTFRVIRPKRFSLAHSTFLYSPADDGTRHLRLNCALYPYSHLQLHIALLIHLYIWTSTRGERKYFIPRSCFYINPEDGRWFQGAWLVQGQVSVCLLALYSSSDLNLNASLFSLLEQFTVIVIVMIMSEIEATAHFQAIVGYAQS